MVLTRKQYLRKYLKDLNARSKALSKFKGEGFQFEKGLIDGEKARVRARIKYLK